MLHVESIAPSPSSATESKLVNKSADPKGIAATAFRLIEVRFRSVELDGRNLWREPAEVAIGQLAEAVRLADLRGKSELMINNITPWIAVGHADSCKIPVIKRNIQTCLYKACKKTNRPVPECRLDLTRGEYSIRCYLGRTKPTDHVYDEDLVSDSR